MVVDLAAPTPVLATGEIADGGCPGGLVSSAPISVSTLLKITLPLWILGRHISVCQRRDDRAQIGHRDPVAAADVDATKQCDVRGHA